MLHGEDVLNGVT